MTQCDENPATGEGVPKPLLIALSAVIGLDMAMYSVVAPLLPALQRDLGMSDSMAGLLVAGYPMGLMSFAIPAGAIVARVGARPAIVVGAATLAVSSVTFGFAASPEWLLVARVVQGFSGALSWAAALTWLIGSVARNRQGFVIGTAMAVAGLGAVAGPGLGVLAALTSRGLVFGGVGIVAFAVATALMSQPAPVHSRGAGMWTTAVKLVRGPGAVLLGVVMLCAVGLGAMAVFAPLRLDDLDASSAFIGVVLLGVAVVELVVAPLLGGLVDRIGPRAPLMVLLLTVTTGVLLHRFHALPLAAAIVLVCMSAVGLLYTPALIGLTELTQSRGLAMAGLFGLSNMVFAVGEGVGALSAGWLEEAEAAAEGLLGLAVLSLCLCTSVVVARSFSRDRRD